MRGVAKAGWNLGPFRTVLVRLQTVGALRIKIVPTTSEQAIPAYKCFVVFRSKKEVSA